MELCLGLVERKPFVTFKQPSLREILLPLGPPGQMDYRMVADTV
jgi:hypothetical protein